MSHITTWYCQRCGLRTDVTNDAPTSCACGGKNFANVPPPDSIYVADA